MSIRTRLLQALHKEIHGPRAGIYEINKNPDFEYLTGVLAPKDLIFDPISEPADLDDAKKIPIPLEDIYSSLPQVDFDDHEEDNPFDLEPSVLDTPLDPRSRPRSLGVSFVLRSNKNPVIDICITFARYTYKAESGSWHRVPEAFYEYDIDASKGWDMRKSKTIPRGVGIYILSSKISSDQWKLSVYFVNETFLKNVEMYKKNDLIFQPQIRIVCGEGTKLSHIDESYGDDREESVLSAMYRNRRMYARGHMCSASWKNQDTRSDNVSRIMFEWVDSEFLPPNVALHFSNPDARTEYLPLYSVQQPAPVNEISAEQLANLFDPIDLKKTLEPIAKGYEFWIMEQKDQLEGNTALNNILRENVDKCEKSLRRIRSAIDLLYSDENVRLAFCFMNAAMDLQFKWETGKTRKTGHILVWYRFQLAFILQCLVGITNGNHPDRIICDLLWYPTGGGKTEAYLALMTFSLAYRRLSATKVGRCQADGGVSVISRYTLRLLTIQQFRRSIKVILACEKLRVSSWKPKGCRLNLRSIWGKSRFSIGLWVGEQVTPNKLEDSSSPDEIYLGAIGELLGQESYYKQYRQVRGNSEPAQVLNCPVCDCILAVPSSQFHDTGGLEGNTHTITWIFYRDSESFSCKYELMNSRGFSVNKNDIIIERLPNPKYLAITVKFSFPGSRLKAENIDSWWNNHVSAALDVRPKDLCPARASRPGYFIKYGQGRPYDFEIRCPNIRCPINSIDWFEEIPSNNGESKYTTVIEAFRKPDTESCSFGMPISAFTTDAQIYRHCPSFVIATVDKFARLPYEPYAASLFGNVNSFDSHLGYFRKKLGVEGDIRKLGYQIKVKPFLPPSLIIQDELHLIEGPLGSIAGVYESAIDTMCSTTSGIKPKYIASTATIKDADNQVKSLFNRNLAIFPSPGLTAEDNYFASSQEADSFDSDPPGRLYVGVCTPGKTLLPIVRLWSVLLKEVQTIYNENKFDEYELDSFWTLVGYFNSLKELAIARAIYSGTEIRGRIGYNNDGTLIRELSNGCALELSGQSSSLDLPNILKRIEKEKDFDVDALFTTSMFGTGVDISRLSLMIVHGQPKSTSSYIQATGRVGRSRGGLVVTFLRSTRPRDLNHYEFFIGYHKALHRFVEPVSVYPFSPKSVSRALGPLAVALLRNAYHIEGTPVNDSWCFESKIGKKAKINRTTSGCREMRTLWNCNEIKKIIEIIEERSQNQAEHRKPAKGAVGKYMKDQFDRWENFAKRFPDDLLYWEQTLSGIPVHPVVLGSPQYDEDRAVFRNSPTSLREVESTCGFGDDVW